MGFTYAKAGVNVWKIKGIQGGIASLLESTLNENVILPAGHYAGVIKIGNKHIAMHTDGVGTKVLIAQLLEKFDTVGIDAVAMNVNDIVCIGARPVALMDYLAIETTDEKQIYEIMKGIAIGAKMVNCPVVGGETAVVPDLIKGFTGRGFDLSISVVGEVDGELITGEKMKTDDVIIGIESSGLHSNGYSLARKVLLNDRNLLNEELLLEMLVPTYIYSNAVLDVLKKVKSVRGMAHITGGAFSKLMRIGRLANKGFLLDNMPEPLPIFNLIQKEGKIEDREMYRTFNMGIGFCIVCDNRDMKKVIEICKKHKFKAQKIGKITSKEEVILQKNGKKTDLA